MLRQAGEVATRLKAGQKQLQALNTSAQVGPPCPRPPAFPLTARPCSPCAWPASGGYCCILTSPAHLDCRTTARMRPCYRPPWRAASRCWTARCRRPLPALRRRARCWRRRPRPWAAPPTTRWRSQRCGGGGGSRRGMCWAAGDPQGAAATLVSPHARCITCVRVLPAGQGRPGRQRAGTGPGAGGAVAGQVQRRRGECGRGATSGEGEQRGGGALPSKASKPAAHVRGSLTSLATPHRHASPPLRCRRRPRKRR